MFCSILVFHVRDMLSSRLISDIYTLFQMVLDCLRVVVDVACENIRFSSLFAIGDVSRGGTSATPRQKFHTDDLKSVRNPVRSADWSTEQLHCFSSCLQMTDKRQKATKVKCKREESLTKQSIFVEYSLLLKKHLSFAGACWQMNTTLYQNRPKHT